MINSGLSARITGNSETVSSGVHIEGDGIVTNSGINAIIEDLIGTAIFIGGDNATVNNTGIGAKIRGLGDEGIKFESFGDGGTCIPPR